MTAIEDARQLIDPLIANVIINKRERGWQARAGHCKQHVIEHHDSDVVLRVRQDVVIWEAAFPNGYGH